jgi:hypothetical protein
MADQLDEGLIAFKSRSSFLKQIESATVTWAPGKAEAVSLDLVDCCVQVTGDFEEGIVTIEGSNDGETFATLTDAPGAVGRTLAFNAPGLKSIAENPMWLRPRRDGAAETTIVLVGRPRP